MGDQRGAGVGFHETGGDKSLLDLDIACQSFLCKLDSFEQKAPFIAPGPSNLQSADGLDQGIVGTGYRFQLPFSVFRFLSALPMWRSDHKVSANGKCIM
jgi:hypothetical protein